MLKSKRVLKIVLLVILSITAVSMLASCAYFPDAPEGISEDNRVFKKIKDTRMVAEAEDYKGFIYKEGADAFCFRLKSPAVIEDGKTYPIVIFLHGSGDGGKDNSAHMYRSLIDSVAAYASEDCFVFMPQNNADRDWSNEKIMGKTEGLSDLYNACLDKLTESYPIDVSRIYLTGMSMGGHGTLWQASERPGYYAALMPVCGVYSFGEGSDLVPKADVLTDLPIWFFHSRNDKTVSFSNSETMSARLTALGNTNVKTTWFDEPLHDITALAYDNAEVWQWLFGQRKA